MHTNHPLLTTELSHDRRVRYEVAALRWAMRTTDHSRGRGRRAPTRRASSDSDTA
jgi:hypothetical protein